MPAVHDAVGPADFFGHAFAIGDDPVPRQQLHGVAALVADRGVVRDQVLTVRDIRLLGNKAGFPPFRGGTLTYADTLGMKTVLEQAASCAALGKLYEPTASMKKTAAEGERYIPK